MTAYKHILQIALGDSYIASLPLQLLKTNVTDISTPLDYSSIEKTSGRANDSGFKNMAEVGIDINLRVPGSSFTLGKEVATLYDIVDDASTKSKKNYSVQHFMERLKIYNEEKFQFKIYNINF